jgi:hypothetical protein
MDRHFAPRSFSETFERIRGGMEARNQLALRQFCLWKFSDGPSDLGGQQRYHPRNTLVTSGLQVDDLSVKSPQL